MTLNFASVFPYWAVLLKGLGITIAFSCSCAVMGSVAGFVLSVLRMSPNPVIKGVTSFYVQFFRGTPLLIQLFWVFFCFPVVFP